MTRCVRKLIALLLSYCLLVCCTTMVSKAVAASEMNQGIASYQDMAITGNDMYVLSNDGIWHRNLLTLQENLLVSYVCLDSWNIVGRIQLFTYQEKLAVIDWESLKVWRWEDTKLVPLVDLHGVEGIDLQYTIRICAQSDSLWILNRGLLWMCDLTSGEVCLTNLTGLSEIASDGQGKLIAVRDNETCGEVISITTDSLRCDMIAELLSYADGGLACDTATGTIYAVVAGELSVFASGIWKPIRALSHTMTWSYAAIYNNTYLYVSDFHLLTVPIEKQSNMTQLVIDGLNMGDNADETFSADHPQISILRKSEDHYCAEEVYQEIITGNSNVDLFCIAMSSGLIRLFEKGYIAPLSTSAVLQADYNNLYAFAQESCAYRGVIYAVPSSMTLGAWMLMNDQDADEIPSTITSLISFEQEWKDSDEELLAVAEAYGNESWSAREHVLYILKQYIMNGSSSETHFRDAALSTQLMDCLTLRDTVSTASTGSESSGNALITVSDYNFLSGDTADTYTLLTPPALQDDTVLAIPATMYVYVMNPRSLHPQEALAYLEHAANSRSAEAQAMLHEDGQAVMLPSYQAEKTRIDEEIRLAEETLSACKEENKRFYEDHLASLRRQAEQIDQSNIKWIVHPDALDRYRSDYVPYINLQTNPLLESSAKSHTDMWSLIVNDIDLWLDHQIMLDQCLERLDTLCSKYADE